MQFRGTHQTVRLRLPGDVTVTATVAAALGLDAGDEMAVQFPAAACRVFPTGTDLGRDAACSPAAQSATDRERFHA